jgi:multiple sugar transport system permease protein
MSGKKIRSKGGAVSYAKWGYIFILPFFLAFAIFQLIPLASTIYYSFFEYYRSGLKIIGPNFVGLENYKSLFQSDFLQYAKNTFILWIAGFIPQIVVSLILAAWFTDQRLKIKGKQFFKVVIYMPNLIMASAFSMLFFALFSDIGPVNGFLATIGAIDLEHPVRFFASVGWTRTLIALMNFLMWFGNTTIMLMAAVMGISPSLFEAAELDGANHRQVFFKVTLPNIKPILVYVLITSLICGLQMYDVPQILTNGSGNPNRSSMTLLMFLNSHLYSKNFGIAGALSVILFVVSAILCLIVYFSLNKEDSPATSKHSKKRKH